MKKYFWVDMRFNKIGPSSDIPCSSCRGVSADDAAVGVVGAAAAEGVGERGVHERGVLEALPAAGRGAGDVVGALLVQVEAKVLQVRVLPQQVALSAIRELKVFKMCFYMLNYNMNITVLLSLFSI